MRKTKKDKIIINSLYPIIQIPFYDKGKSDRITKGGREIINLLINKF
jgi:hypothetical protein